MTATLRNKTLISNWLYLPLSLFAVYVGTIGDAYTNRGIDRFQISQFLSIAVDSIWLSFANYITFWALSSLAVILSIAIVHLLAFLLFEKQTGDANKGFILGSGVLFLVTIILGISLSPPWFWLLIPISIGECGKYFLMRKNLKTC